MAAVLRYFDRLEIGWCLRINRFGRPASLRRLFAVVSRLGDGPYWLVMGFLCIAWRGAEALPFVAHAGVTAAFGILLYKALKSRLVRERPFVANGRIFCGAAPLDRYSFPSGHTLHAVSFTILFAQFEPLLLGLTAPFACLVATSRVVLGLHYPSDVVAGAMIGTGLATVSLSVTVA
jgi:undecaprenyl-diphosphatase